jgi:hypothetical protein
MQRHGFVQVKSLKEKEKKMSSRERGKASISLIRFLPG